MHLQTSHRCTAKEAAKARGRKAQLGAALPDGARFIYGQSEKPWLNQRDICGVQDINRPTESRTINQRALTIQSSSNCQQPRRRGHMLPSRIISILRCNHTPNLPRTCRSIYLQIFSPRYLASRITRRSAGLRQLPDESPQVRVYRSLLSTWYTPWQRIRSR